MKNSRSMLFMPGNNPGMLVSADNLDADCIIYDLEDAVSLEEKDAARLLVASALKHLPFSHAYVTVRINPIDSPYWQEDLDAILGMDLDGIVVPKASLESVQKVEDYLEAFYQARGQKKDLRLLMLLETAQGIIEADRIAQASDRIDALLLGGEDYSVSMGVKRTKSSKELEYARFRLATVAKAYGLDAIDTPYTDIGDLEGLKEDTAFAKSIGFNGRLVIHPRQIPTIHQIFNPSRRELEEAQAILAASKEAKERGLGVFSFKGKMVDKPVMERAENLVKTAKERGLLP